MKKSVIQIGFVLLALAVPAFSQTSGSIDGVVKDQSGAVVPNASVTVANHDTGVVNKTTSLSDGKYQVINLNPGVYDVSAEAAGFKQYKSTGIEVHVADKLTINIPLELGEARETVTVTDEAPLLRTEDTQTGEVINNTFISNMPQLNRNPFALLSLSGDVSGSAANAANPGTAAGTSTVAINGGRTSSVDYYVDGGVVNSGQGNGLTNQTPSMDAVAEFKVVTSGISAEYGRISGGFITLVTKSGSNQYHGSLYEYMFNDMFNANAWDQNALGNKKVHFRQNDYGFTLGGPVRIPKVYNGKNRTFFFVENEYLKKTQAGSIVLNSVPSAAERGGDLSAALYNGKKYPTYDPNGPVQLVTSGTYAGFYQRLGLLGGDGYHVPASQISPVSTAILALIPMPNRPSVANSSELNNYGYASSSSIYNYRFGVKLDHNVTDHQHMSLRYATYDSNAASTPTMATPLYTSGVTQSNGGFSANLNYTWTATPSMIVDFRNSVTFSPNLVGTAHAADFNNSFLPAIYKQYIGNEIPNISETFMSGTAYGQRAAQAITNSTSYTFAGSVTKVLTKHNLKAGYEYRRYYDNFRNVGSSNVLNFMTDPVFQYSGDWGLGANEGRINGLSSFLMGINDQNNIAQPTTRDMNTNYVGAYVQDDWKVNQKFTVNLGLRWDDERPTTERYNQLYFWDPAHVSLFPVIPGYSFAAALAQAGLPANTPVPDWAKTGQFQPGAVNIAGSKTFAGRSPQTAHNFQFAPRIGLAYQLNKKTVIRAFGGKMFLGTTGNPNSYATANSNIALSNQAFAGWHASTDGGVHYISTFANPFPLASMFSTPTRDILTINQQSSLDPGASAVSADEHMPREYDWSFNIQRQIPWDTLLEVGYSGNRGLGLLATDTISHYPANLLVPQYAASMQQSIASPNAGETAETTITGSKQQLGLLEYNYPYYGRVQVSGINEGRSLYNALLVKVDKRLAKGMQILVNYTMSKQMDDVGGPDGTGGKTAQSVLPFHSVYGLSTLDQTHRLNIAYTYVLPFGEGRRFMGKPTGFAEKALDYVVGGWQLAGNWAYHSGAPITLTGSTTSNVNNGIKINQTWGSYATSSHDLTPANFTNLQQVLTSAVTPITSSSIRFLDPAKVVGAQLFVLGNLPPNDPNYRQPSFHQMDISLMKNFKLWKEGTFLQIRAEGQNAFNIRGFGNVNASIGNANYGLITTAGNTPRQIQLSARINF